MSLNRILHKQTQTFDVWSFHRYKTSFKETSFLKCLHRTPQDGHQQELKTIVRQKQMMTCYHSHVYLLGTCLQGPPRFPRIGDIFERQSLRMWSFCKQTALGTGSLHFTILTQMYSHEASPIGKVEGNRYWALSSIHAGNKRKIVPEEVKLELQQFGEVAFKRCASLRVLRLAAQ